MNVITTVKAHISLMKSNLSVCGGGRQKLPPHPPLHSNYSVLRFKRTIAEVIAFRGASVHEF